MTQTYEISTGQMPVESTSLVKRISVFSYGLLAYMAGCAGLFWLILAMGGIAPVGLSEFKSSSNSVALLVNFALIVIFGVQHSVMARQKFKDWLTRYIPQAAERSTYMFMSGIVTLIAIYFWQPIAGTAWSVQSLPGQIALYSLFALGAGYLLLSTFVTNHFELMGLRQVYLYLTNRPYTKLPFTRKYMYSYSRHPMMLGMLGVLWAAPEMSVTRLVLSILITAYMAVGMFFEERDLIKAFGDTYREYKKQIATFMPRVY